MLLAGVYNDHRGPLLASIRAEYGIGFRDLPLRELSELVANLPPGCALWRATGGPNAWSAEMHLLNHIEWRLQILDWRKTPNGQKGRNQPKLSKPPAYASEDSPENAHTERQAAAYQRRQARTQ
ncbi:MAG TPA: DUF5361 domain-containing protein [Plantibacter sp.]|uniref:DUF5361 domain-containing protein n=1 Tax=Plantibacter sp. TaxID=1871045 RepID=UPI002CDD26F1|nr:DUF5361 domain-containing protein [Plantibacter sp.]